MLLFNFSKEKKKSSHIFSIETHTGEGLGTTSYTGKNRDKNQLEK